jgi:N-acetyl-1-D-myo-inositol-2-amino-2-deoxy-alpha-D-glucopyranoside deacetylase
VLFVHAHPDDETIVTGGTIAKLVDSGAAVTVLTCTRGERGEVIPPELKHLEGKRAELAEFRSGELAEAMRILGVADHRFLGSEGARWAKRPARRYLDSGMRWGEHGALPLPDLERESLCAADPEEVAADVAAVIADTAADAVVSYDETGGYGHPDHIRAHLASRQAAQAMGVPFFTIERPDSPRPDTISVDVTAQLERKTEALRAYPTQITVTADRYALSSGPDRPIAAVECFRRMGEGPRAARVAWHDQGLARKSAGSVLALLTGVVVGALATVNHQVSVVWFGVQVPFGVVASLGLVTALLLGLRLFFGTRLMPALAALGLLAALGTLSLAGVGGSVLVPANPLGWVWTFGAPLIALVVLGWPRLGASRHPGRARKITSADTVARR